MLRTRLTLWLVGLAVLLCRAGLANGPDSAGYQVVVQGSTPGQHDEPIIDDDDTAATKLQIDKDEGTKLLIGKEEELAPKPMRPEKLSRFFTPGEVIWQVALRSRYIFLPDAILDKVFSTHTSLHSYAIGVECIRHKVGSFDISFGLDYSSFKFPAGNWAKDLEELVGVDFPFQDVDYVDISLSMLSLEATFIWHIEFHRRVSMYLGAGLGIGFLLGDVTTTDVFSTCKPPVEKCGHWDEVTRQERDLPSRVWPVLHLLLGFNFYLHDRVFLRIETGFHNIFFAGGAVGFSI